MRVVLDTNVLMSGLLFGGMPGRIVEAWRRGRIEVVLTPAVLTEHERVAEALSKRYPEVAITALLRILASLATRVDDRDLSEPVCADPDNDKFLACALSGHATLVVSGEKALIAASGYRGIAVVTPRAFMDSLP